MTAGVSIVLQSISETGEDSTSSGGGTPGNPNLENSQATKELNNLTLQVTKIEIQYLNKSCRCNLTKYL